MLSDANDFRMELSAIEINTFLDCILEVVYKFAGERPIALTSSSPELCMALSVKQETHPILFVVESVAGQSVAYDAPAVSVQIATRFARRLGVAGIVMGCDLFVLPPGLVEKAHERGLVCWSCGNLSDEPDNALKQAEAAVNATAVRPHWQRPEAGTLLPHQQQQTQEHEGSHNPTRLPEAPPPPFPHGHIQGLQQLLHRGHKLPKNVTDEFWLDAQKFPLLHRIVLGLNGTSLHLWEALGKELAKVDEEDVMGRTALHCAAARGDKWSTAVLLSYGADPNRLDCQYAGPLSYAADNNQAVCTRLLLDAGAHTDPHIPGGHLISSPLNSALRNASEPIIIKYLLDHGADIDACVADGYTPLTTAIVNNSHEVLRLLLDRWAKCRACPRLSEGEGRHEHLLGLAARFADHKTPDILSLADHIRLKYDVSFFCAGGFHKILEERRDKDEGLRLAFARLMSTVRGEPQDSPEFEEPAFLRAAKKFRGLPWHSAVCYPTD
ncbi:ankyrin repeat-containing domain protein [Cladorrhinum sp. PSN332]|nr:ankyrin repeat-containing domain protein [Cladorrhinum sp. PSN332]